MYNDLQIEILQRTGRVVPPFFNTMACKIARPLVKKENYCNLSD